MVGRFEGRGRAVWVFERDFMVFFWLGIVFILNYATKLLVFGTDICLFVRRQFIDKGVSIFL